MREEEIKNILLRKSEEFRKIYEEHQRCESALKKIQAKGFLSEAERVEEKELKKKKLKLKDEMFRLMAQFQKQTGEHE
ncbi:MAG: DUF465 domain-containing protein [Candidatus Saccharicenans sp.]|nr:MAG: hypothetical protein C0168_07185 [Candidatus Aminicenantes bacterium]HEK85591.1 DUF465 domain-containing protein [Candidatus Aminicenantes bacterium]